MPISAHSSLAPYLPLRVNYDRPGIESGALSIEEQVRPSLHSLSGSGSSL